MGSEGADLRAAELAQQRKGVLAAELEAVGLRRDAVRRRDRRGILHPLYPGVFAFGSPEPSPLGRLRAAVLSCGHDFLVSDSAAAYVWGFTDEWGGVVEVLGPRQLRRTGIKVRRTAWLPDEDRKVRRYLPVTSPARTVIDVGATGEPALHEHVIASALRSRWVTVADLWELARTSRPGAKALREQLARVGGVQFSRSEAERIVLGLVRRARLPPPLANKRVHGAERDLVWPDARVVVEFDGDAFHWSPRAKRADNRRDGDLALRGWQTVRLSWYEINEEPYAVVARLAAALANGHTAWAWVSGNTPPA